ncbi:MAG: hypothetical protein K2K26_10600 [Muribaculaceae bacterium]|nr:hypothetical protein [Muribaculaceae bacterium]
MKRHKSYILSLVTFTLLLVGCTEIEHSEQVTSEIEAAQLEGRSYARLVVNRDWTGDTLGLQDKLLEVRSRQSRYLLEGHPEQAAAFDSTFLSTLRAVEPQLARKLTAAPLNTNTK